MLTAQGTNQLKFKRCILQSRCSQTVLQQQLKDGWSHYADFSPHFTVPVYGQKMKSTFTILKIFLLKLSLLLLQLAEKYHSK